MKKLISTLSLLLLVAFHIYAQTPEAINYQAVARDVNGSVLTSRLLGFQISVLQGSSTGTAVYVERHSINSNAFGLVNFRIGDGSAQSGTFAAINWASGPYYIQIELDPQGGTSFQLMSTSQLVSVPYALHAKSADNVTDAIQVLSKNGNVVSLNPNGGSFVDEVNDADSDPNNEIQTLSKTGNQIFLSLNGGSVIDEVDDADNDPTNELQILSFSNDTLYISNGNNVFLGLSTLNTDSQNLSFSNDTLYIDNGNFVFLGGYTAAINAVNAARTNDSTTFANGLISAEAARLADSTLFATHVANDFDNDSTNELQLLSFSNDTLYLSNGNDIYLGSLSTVNTDSQNLSFSNDTLYIDNGNFVFLGGYTAAINAVNAARNQRFNNFCQRFNQCRSSTHSRFYFVCSACC
jgi:hypothetical protein